MRGLLPRRRTDRAAKVPQEAETRQVDQFVPATVPS